MGVFDIIKKKDKMAEDVKSNPFQSIKGEDLSLESDDSLKDFNPAPLKPVDPFDLITKDEPFNITGLSKEVDSLQNDLRSIAAQISGVIEKLEVLKRRVK